MASKKPSFFERLSGSASIDDSVDTFEDEETPRASSRAARTAAVETHDATAGQLPVDVHQTPTEIVLRAFVAGVRPDELSISISRDMVSIEGSRMERDQISSGDYFTQELFWGSFARTILLPQEVDVDGSIANAKDGLLTITLPKLDKTRQTKLRVKAG